MNLIYAANIHCGGGKVLLSSLLSEIEDLDNWLVVLDSRLDLPKELEKKVIFRVRPTIFGRLLAELRIFLIGKKFSNILFFGNLPPILRNNSKVHLFVQNMYIVSQQPLSGFSFRDKLRIYLERLWFNFFIEHADRLIVQSDSMSRQIFFSQGRIAEVLPFTEKNSNYKPIKINETLKKYSLNDKQDFIFVASGEPHKNHRRLIEAWKLLAKKNIFPSLCLTLDRNTYSQLCDWIESEKLSCNLKVNNLGLLSADEVKDLYRIGKALVYPSLIESFGLPIIEARKMGLPIVAGELDYVRDLTNPEQTFDPHSAVSISRAIERFLNINSKTISPKNPFEFLCEIK